MLLICMWILIQLQCISSNSVVYIHMFTQMHEHASIQLHVSMVIQLHLSYSLACDYSFAMYMYM